MHLSPPTPSCTWACVCIHPLTQAYTFCLWHRGALYISITKSSTAIYSTRHICRHVFDFLHTHTHPLAATSVHGECSITDALYMQQPGVIVIWTVPWFKSASCLAKPSLDCPGTSLGEQRAPLAYIYSSTSSSPSPALGNPPFHSPQTAALAASVPPCPRRFRVLPGWWAVVCVLLEVGTKVTASSGTDCTAVCASLLHTHKDT